VRHSNSRALRGDRGAAGEGDLAVALDREPHVPSGVTPRWRDGVGGVRLVSDRVQIKKIVKNLVGNALKFIAAGSVEVSATAAGGMLTLVVRDTGIGIGIAPESLPVIDMLRQAATAPPPDAMAGSGSAFTS
jgi:signal transduction histidine kinase